MDIRAIRITPSNLDAAALAGVNRVVIGTGVYVSDTQGTDNSSANNSPAALKKPVADYPAVAEQNGDKATIVAALEYGAQIGVYEIGLYADDTHVATLQAELGGAGISPILHLHKRCIYALSMTIETANEAAKLVKLAFEARADLTYAMLWHSHQSGFKLPIAETQTGNTVDDSASGAVGVDGNDGIIWDELVNCTEEKYLYIWDGNGLHSGGYTVKLKSDVRTFRFYCLYDRQCFTLELVPADYKMNGDPIVPADKRNFLIAFNPDFITIWDSHAKREIVLPMVYKVIDPIAVQLETNRITISNLDNHQQMIFSGNFGNDAAVIRAIPSDGTIGNVAIEPITNPTVLDFTPNVVHEQ